MINYDVGVWTSAGATYAQLIMENIAPLDSFHFIWSRERCTTRFNSGALEYYQTKKLKKVLGKGWAKERILAIDDTPSKWESSYGNYLPISPFRGDSTDQELLYIMEYLDTLKDEPSVRKIDKRNWRNQTSAPSESPAQTS